MTRIPLTVFSLALFTLASARADEQLLRDAEISRGVLSANGIAWTVNAEGSERGETRNAKLIVKAQGPYALAEIVEPADSAGKKYLLSGGEMYFYRPGASRPVKVPRRQQVTGDASIGELASASFLDEYQIASTGSEDLNGETCTVFDLEAKAGAKPTYAKIKLWVSNSARVSRQANFFTASGKHLRTATYEHNSSVTVGGKAIPFLSKLTVQELLGTPKTTILTYSAYKLTSFPEGTFDLDAMAAGS